MALKIVHKICYGIDVHKTFVVACIASTNKQGITTYNSHHFSTYTRVFKELLQYLLKFNCKDICMESTGKYGFLHTISYKKAVLLYLRIPIMLRLFVVKS